MTFRELLAKVVDPTPGGRAAVIMGSDGIPVEEYRAQGEGLDLPTVAVEFQRVLEEAHKVTGLLGSDGGGPLQEVILETAQLQILFRPIDHEYYLIVALDRNGFLGKARYLVSSLLQDLREEL
jgi:predicted regulator of Ras-like GTPase activity (Roadblock/LC7/MglB family)